LTIYFDTSALVPLYVTEPLTEEVVARLGEAEVVYISRLAEVEFYSAVARKRRLGEITLESCQLLADALRRHLSSGVYTFLHVTDEDFELASEFLRRFETSLRTLDALHLACSTACDGTLITADQVLAESADHLGVDYERLAVET
jgi:predicted nucleic acid-binding protein